MLLGAMLGYVWFRRWWVDRDSLSLGWTMLLILVIAFQIPFVVGPAVSWVPLIGLIQFPSRFFVLIALSLAVWVASARNPSELKSAWIMASTASLSVPVLGCIFFFVHPVRTLTEFPIEQKAHWSAFEYTPIQTISDSGAVLGYTSAHQHDSEINSSMALPDGDTLQTIDVRPNSSHLSIELQEGLSVRFHRFYWPEWHLFSSRGEQIIPSYDSSGILKASLPSGSYELTLDMIESDAEHIGKIVSCFGIGILVIFYLSGVVIDARRIRFNRVFSDS